MNELVFKGNNDQALTSSLLVAEKFGKNHRDVLESIRNLVAENSAASLLFAESQYENRGKMYPMYIMNRDGFTLLVMGFTGKDALQFKLDYIHAFNQMEQTIKSGGFQVPTSFKEALLLAAQQQEKIESQQKHILKLQPKADFADQVFRTDSKLDVGLAAKTLKLPYGRNTLFKKLREAGVFFANRNEPKQRFVDAGYFELKEKFIERDSHPGFCVIKILVTQKGLAYINMLLGGNPTNYKLANIN
ncbi:Rha family transcriptional regulator [Bacteroides reticulotermitis]|uniref:Rha family transcriptional regulator n=1 Tax=Bacteroides reticulotermitis TaxID=1133319 RepID=UPI003A8A555D